MTRPSPLLILGCGYTGRHIYAQALAAGREVFVTSRTPDRHLVDLPLKARLTFRLEDTTTWRTVPSNAECIWCFPAVPVGAVHTWAEFWIRSAQERRLVVLGSTSAYDPPSNQPSPATDDAPLIDEGSPLNLTLPRVQGEEQLRTHCGAVILRAAGIYGPGRNVLNWIRRGHLVPSRRWLNLIHVEDLAAICLHALACAPSGESYLVSDGTPRQCHDLCKMAARRWKLASPGTQEDAPAGKRVSIEKLRRELGYRFRYPDLYAALEEMESSRSGADAG